ncbi:MAG TPA: LysR family transcriptional regulator [Kofleriaceae bacterium]|nr:LysR family transcriptional regulator [Kofleriaceae bacterium]
MIPDLDMWRCFEAAATYRTFRRAARELSLSMRMFEYRIKRLELALGTELFIRAYGRAVLTPDGERLLPQAFRMLDQAASPGRLREPPPPLELTVGATADVGVSWLAQSFERLHAYRPDRTLRVQLGDADDLLARIRGGALDCAITSVEQVADGLVCEVLHRQELVFVAATSLVRRRPFSQRAHAARHVLVDMAEDLPLFRTVLEALGDREPWRFASVEYYETAEAIRDRLLQGDGVAVLPRRIVARDLRARRLKQLMRDVELPQESFVLVWRRDHARDLEIRRLASDLARAPL